MRQALTVTMVVLLALAGGCSQDQNATGASTGGEPRVEVAKAPLELTPEQLGELGAQIRKTPDRAEALLSQHGLTKESFETQIRKITENPDASKRYADAYRKASA